MLFDEILWTRGLFDVLCITSVPSLSLDQSTKTPWTFKIWDLVLSRPAVQNNEQKQSLFILAIEIHI